MAHSKHAEVRANYYFRCGYCGVTEGESGGDLTVDHFLPASAGGDESDDNLVYCCFRCNTYKGDFVPNADDKRHGLQVLHPRLDRPEMHFRENIRNGLLEPLTNKGRFHIELLHLNRPQLVELRLTRRLHSLLADSCRMLQEENEHLRLQIVMLEQYVEELRRRRYDPGTTGSAE